MNETERDLKVDPPNTGVIGLQVMLIVHAVIVVALGIPLWRLFLGLNELSAIGNPEMSDPTGMNVFLALLLGPTPLLNPLAALSLTRHPRRAKVYLALAGIAAWLQVIATIVIAVAFTFIGGFFLLFLVVPFAWLVFAWTRAAIRVGPARSSGGAPGCDASCGHPRSIWRHSAASSPSSDSSWRSSGTRCYEGLGVDDPIELNVQTGCVKRVGTPPCLDPQGGVPPEADQIIGIRCEA